MKKLIVVLVIIVSFCSCVHRNDGKLVKDMDGNIYRIDKDGRCSECYGLKPLDTAKYNVMFKCK